MTLLALVEPGMAASAQLRACEPVEHEQRAFDPPQLLECEVELVLAAVGREFSQHDGRRHDAGAFSDERLIDAAVAVVAERPEQRPLLVVALSSRLEVVVDAPPTPPTEPSAGVERWIGSIKLYRALARAPVVMLVTISWRLWAASPLPAF